MAVNWLSGTPPRKTRASVPRLTPDHSVRTSTSSGPGRGRGTGRISPSPGARSQKAYAGTSTSPPGARRGVCPWRDGVARVERVTGVRSRTRHQLAAAAGAQVVLLAALSAEVGLGPVGWLTGGSVLL